MIYTTHTSSTPYNYPPHLPDFEDMDSDGAIEILMGEEEDGYQHTRFENVAYYRNQGLTHPWRHTKDWVPTYDPPEEDFAWALSRVLDKITCASHLHSMALGLSDDECRRIYSMRDRAREVAKNGG
jgi:hypothetical protein